MSQNMSPDVPMSRFWILGRKREGPGHLNRHPGLVAQDDTENKRLTLYRGETGKRTDNKTQPKTPDSLCPEASQATGAAPTLRYGPAGDSAPRSSRCIDSSTFSAVDGWLGAPLLPQQV